jgi:hypothetical protein
MPTHTHSESEGTMSIATQAQKSTQAQVMSQTAQATSNPQVMSFSRFVSLVAGKSCNLVGIHPNGHLTQANAGLCAQARAEEFLSTLPQDTTEAQALEALGKVQILTIQRFMCLSAPVPQGWTQGEALPQKCKFGHKTQAQADKCVGTQASTQAKVASKIQVTLGGSLADILATQATQAQATPEASQGQPEATPEASQGKAQATQGKATQRPRLTSGSKGNTGRA